MKRDMMNDVSLLPQPRRVERRPQALALQLNRLIWLDRAAPQRLRFAAQRFKQALFYRKQLTWPIGAAGLGAVQHQRWVFAAQRFKQELFDRTQLTWPIVGAATAADQAGLALHLTPDRVK